MFGSIFSNDESGNTQQRIGELPSHSSQPICKRLLVIDGDASHDWAGVFAGATVAVSGNNVAIQVVQVGWGDILCTSDDGGCQVDVIAKRAGVAAAPRTFKPDFVLVRNEVRGIDAATDFRHNLWGLMHGGVPSINSLASIMAFCERPVVHAELKAIQRRVGKGVFPVISQTYYPGHRSMLFGPGFPAVIKVGHAHAGYGKMRVNHHHDFGDFASVMAVAGSYCTAEPFVEADYDLRIQKIGRHYRAFKRISASGSWKTNVGTSIIQQIPVSEAHKRWADEAAKMFGGLDICTVDALHRHGRGCACGSESLDGGNGGCSDTVTGRCNSAVATELGAVDEVLRLRAALEREAGDSGADSRPVEDEELILEVNGTASGLMPDCADEDHQHIRDLVLAKMTELWS